jgi:hypothetical protein
MIYHDPATVLSPRDCIDQVQVLYDGGLTDLYSLAIVTWEGQDRIGIRWNVNQREWNDPQKSQIELQVLANRTPGVSPRGLSCLKIFFPICYPERLKLRASCVTH